MSRWPRLPPSNRIALSSVKPGVIPHGVNLFEHRDESDTAARARWNATVETLNARPMPKTKGRLAGLSEKQAKQLHHLIKTNPIAQNIERYAPNGGCFMVAKMAHLLALHAGVDKKSIVKLVKVWDVNSNISHHVALGVRADDGGWWSLDQLDPRPKRLETYGMPGTFVTEATRFGIEGQHAEGYDQFQLFTWVNGAIDRSQPMYNGAIYAMRDYFKSKPPRALDVPLPKRVRHQAPTNEADRQTVAALQRMQDSFRAA